MNINSQGTKPIELVSSTSRYKSFSDGMDKAPGTQSTQSKGSVQE